MKAIRSVALAAVVLTLLVALSGCSGISGIVVDPSAPNPDVAEAPPSPLPSEAQIPGAASFTMQVTDSSGYLFDVAVTMAPLTVSVDTVNAPPGRALVTFGGSGNATVTSTSPGKLAPVYDVLQATGVAAFWPGQSGICAVSPEVANRLFVINNSQRERGPDGCTLNFFVPDADNPLTLAEGASIDVPIVLLGDQFETSEADAMTLTAAIAEQSQVWLGAGSNREYNGGCTLGSVDIFGWDSNVILGRSVMWASASISGCPIPQVGTPGIVNGGGTITTDAGLSGTTWGGTDSDGDTWVLEFQADNTVGLTFGGNSFDDKSDTWVVSGGVLNVTVVFDDGTAALTGPVSDGATSITLNGTLGAATWTLPLTKQ